MRKLILISIMLSLIAPLALAQVTPYDALAGAYRPYLADDAAFALKLKAISADPYKFWRGTKDLYYTWCKENTQDWLADRKAFLPCHGDLHLGNIGTYPRHGAWGKLGLGMVDFDESAVMPFQIELLHVAITLKLVAQNNRIPLDENAARAALKQMLDSYAQAMQSTKCAGELLSDDALLTGLLARTSADYSDAITSFTKAGKFRSRIEGKDGKLKETLLPAMNQADAIAAALWTSINTQPSTGELFRYRTQAEVRNAIRDIAYRTRIDSSGSQGLKKILVLMDRPLRGVDHHVILYLKQQIPSAAERSGMIAKESRPASQRTAEYMSRLTNPPAFLNVACDVGDESYWLCIKDPWSDELNPGSFDTADKLCSAARILGTIAGAAHRDAGENREVILARLKPTLAKELDERSEKYVKKAKVDFATFCGDVRVKKLVGNRYVVAE